MQAKDIRDVAEGHLCTGCGTCAYLEPATITMVNITSKGLRPLIADGASTQAATLAACPGAGLAHNFDRDDPELVAELRDTWGPVLTIWEGYASDDAVRAAGSSAGAATVLATHCLENENMAGVLHVGAQPAVPFLNETIFSTSRDELFAATGSRYAPASPCDRLDLIEQSNRPCVFIGKPCDVAGAQAARKVRPALDANLGLTIAVFCAGTPSTEGTLEMLRAMGVHDLDDLSDLRYRGNGWPGLATATTADGQRQTLTYEQSWGDILQKHRQWRCYVCADHTGEFADVAVGDPWYHEVDGSDPGRSLIVARTAKGRRIVEAAIEAGLLTAWVVSPDLLPRSQPNLEVTRGAVWGRIVVSRLFGAFAPRYRNMPMFRVWMRSLTWREKVGSTGGTARRVFRKGLRERAPVRRDDAYVLGEPSTSSRVG